MHPAEWIALISPGLVIAAALLAAVVKLTRMTVALETFTEDMRALGRKVKDHDRRIATLEGHARGRHRAG